MLSPRSRAAERAAATVVITKPGRSDGDVWVAMQQRRPRRTSFARRRLARRSLRPRSGLPHRPNAGSRSLRHLSPNPSRARFGIRRPAARGEPRATTVVDGWRSLRSSPPPSSALAFSSYLFGTPGASLPSRKETADVAPTEDNESAQVPASTQVPAPTATEPALTPTSAPTSPPSSAPTSSLLPTTTVGEPSGDDFAPLLSELAALIGEPASTRPRYDRESFNEGADLDGDCIRTRHEVLIEEATDSVTMSVGGCSVAVGDWYDPFTGRSTADPRDLQVDHVVSLSDAWHSGAWAWSPGQKTEFSNDSLEPERHLGFGKPAQVESRALAVRPAERIADVRVSRSIRRSEGCVAVVDHHSRL